MKKNKHQGPCLSLLNFVMNEPWQSMAAMLARFGTSFSCHIQFLIRCHLEISAVQVRLTVLPPRLAQLNSQPCEDLSGHMAHQRAKTLHQNSHQNTALRLYCMETCSNQTSASLRQSDFILKYSDRFRRGGTWWNGSAKGLICIGLRSSMCCRFW